MNILDLRVYHLIRLARIVWIYWLLKRRNLGIFILGKSIFIWFLERSLEILVKFRVGLVAKILIIHVLVVHFIVIKITCLLFLIILMWKIIKVGFGVIRVVRRRAKNILLALNRVLVILDIICALLILIRSTKLRIVSIFLLIWRSCMLFCGNTLLVLKLLLWKLLVSWILVIHQNFNYFYSKYVWLLIAIILLLNNVFKEINYKIVQFIL